MSGIGSKCVDVEVLVSRDLLLERTNLLSLPNELLYYEIFIYLRSADLVYAFGRLAHRRLNSLLRAYIRHIDLSSVETSLAEACLSYLSCWGDPALSLRINSSDLNEHFPRLPSELHRLDLQLTAGCQEASKIITLTQLRVLSITGTSFEEPATVSGLSSYIWNSSSHLEQFSSSNCFVLQKEDLSPVLPCLLTSNPNLTRLSLDLGHICMAIALMPFVPALVHLEVRLHKVYASRVTFKREFLQRRTWPTTVKSLRFIAHDQLMDALCFCSFIKRYASLEHLSFYISTHRSYLMSGWQSLERNLVVHLPHLRRLEFCVHSGVMNLGTDRRRTFDQWTREQVVSIFHRRKFHTRFTLPFAFDRLEHVCNAFTDFHTNSGECHPHLSLPSLREITLGTHDELSVGLFALIRQACPFLRHVRFERDCCLSDDLVEDTQLTLPTVTELSLDHLTCSIRASVVRRVLSLAPNLARLSIKRRHAMAVIDSMDKDGNPFNNIRQVVVFECQCNPVNIQGNLSEFFRTAPTLRLAKKRSPCFYRLTI